jgi:hypothetical protein
MFDMKHGLIAGALAVCLALGLGSAPAHAQSSELPVCNEASLWSVAVTTEIDPLGTLSLTFLCTPDGWLLVGASYCSVTGSCSSD